MKKFNTERFRNVERLMKLTGMSQFQIRCKINVDLRSFKDYMSSDKQMFLRNMAIDESIKIMINSAIKKQKS